MIKLCGMCICACMCIMVCVLRYGVCESCIAILAAQSIVENNEMGLANSSLTMTLAMTSLRWHNYLFRKYTFVYSYMNAHSEKT